MQYCCISLVCLFVILTTATTTTATVSLSLSPTEQIVQNHYETFPYPPPNHRTEPYYSGMSLYELNHFLWGGRRNFTHTGLNILIAGGGTSSQAAVIAKSFIDNNVSGAIVHLDLSQASINVARQDAVAYGVEHRIRFVQGSLIDVVHNQNVMQHVPAHGFDLIISTGVLHHLNNPTQGLASLAAALAPRGGLFIMLYGKYGRNGIYPLQEMFRSLLSLKHYSLAERLSLAKQIMKSVPKNHPFFQGPAAISQDALVVSLENNEKDTEAGLYDLLLHSQDVPYTVDSIVEMAKNAQVKLIDFVHSAKYNPLQIINASTVGGFAQLYANMTRFEIFASGERLAGSILKHYFYAVRGDDPRHEQDIHAGFALRNVRGVRGTGIDTSKGFNETLLKTLRVCVPTILDRGTMLPTVMDLIVTFKRDIMVARLEAEGIQGWFETWAMASGEGSYDVKTWNTNYHELPPLGAEIAAATLVANADGSRCTAAVDLLNAVKARLDGFELTWDVFGPQLAQIIQLGESMLHLSIEY